MQHGVVPKWGSSSSCESTMAAESASLSIALDRQLYLRLLVEAMLHGEPESYLHDWHMKLKVPGLCVTDAESLF